MAMGELMKVVLLLCCVLVFEAQAASLTECSDDNDCQIGNFCYLSTQRCTACVDCAAYQRQPASTCAREPAQCGECVTGFAQEILTNGITRGLCIPSIEYTTTISVKQPPVLHTAGGSLWLYAIFGCCFLLGVICFIAGLKKYKHCLKIKWQNRFFKCNEFQSSLSCTPFAPSAPPQSHAGDAGISDDEAGARMFHSFYCEREDEKCQKASKFLNPVWVRDPHSNQNNNNNNNVPGDEPPGDVVDGPVENAPFLIDENTLPSDWTPGTEYDGGEPTGASSSEAPLVTSFAGILQLNALATGAPHTPTNHTAGAQDNDHDPNANSQGQHQQFVTVTNIVNIVNNGAPSTTGIFNITKT